MPSFLRSKSFWLSMLFPLIVLGIVYVAWRMASPRAPAVSPPLTATDTLPTSTSNEDARTTDESPSTSESDQDAEPPTSPSTYTDCGSSTVCDADYQKYCATGLESTDWVNWASERGYRTGSKKYARTDCLDAQGSALTSECRSFQDCHQALNDELSTKCGKYAAPGAVCAGVTPAPGKSPLEDCLAEHLDEIDAACLDAYTRHEANRLQ